MTPDGEALKLAKAYVDRALSSQRKLGYRRRPPAESYDAIVKETAQAVEPLLRLARNAASH